MYAQFSKVILYRCSYNTKSIKIENGKRKRENVSESRLSIQRTKPIHCMISLQQKSYVSITTHCDPMRSFQLLKKKFTKTVKQYYMSMVYPPIIWINRWGNGNHNTKYTTKLTECGIIIIYINLPCIPT